MSAILVCPAERAAAIAGEHRPSHVLGLASPDSVHGGLAGNPSRRHSPQDDAIGEVLARPGSDDQGVGLAQSGAGLVPADHRLALAFHDIAEPRPGLIPPTARDIGAILAFGQSWDGSRPLLVHCALGISRSTAAALVLACDRWPETTEIEIARRLRAAAPCATPNPLMIALADTALGRQGRLVAAVAEIGRGADYVAQPGFVLGIPQAGSRAASLG